LEGHYHRFLLFAKQNYNDFEPLLFLVVSGTKRFGFRNHKF
jgi:hypothetical protein